MVPIVVEIRAQRYAPPELLDIPMKHLCSSLGLAFALLSVACPGGSGSGDDTSGIPELKPFQDEWREVINTSFPLETVKSITIGRKETNQNFANRGDIEVIFDLDTETIVVDFRKYAFQADQAEAEAVFDRLSAWAYVTSSSPKKPSDMDPEDDCTQGWQSGCKLHVYYDGQAQPVRSGTDIRVHLPKGYRELITVETEDNTSQNSYKLRGDVTIKDLCGSGVVKMSSGVAKVRMCSDLQEGPTCSDDDIAACEDQNWDAKCPCTTFGQLKVTSLSPWAANITVDFPDDLWANVSMENTTAGGECIASFENCGTGCVLDQSSESPDKGKAEYNYPGDPATPGVGYAFKMEANGCESVFYVDGPDDFIPMTEESPKDELRGNLSVCTGCLADL
ncbi:MAG TPA: hypothetical protein ENK31_07675 [Nannocystis exedens]|nr:hypothetical protein [Nannocystis exedens]